MNLRIGKPLDRITGDGFEMSRNSVSAIIPVFNGERYITDALQSVFVQHYEPLEVIVVDDGSTDRSSDIVRSCSRVRYIYQSHQGVSAARNAGIAAARGQFIAFLDGDDIWTPYKLKTQISFHLEHRHISCSVGRRETFLEPGTKLPGWLNVNLLREDEVGYFPSTLVLRRHVFNKVGLYNTGYKTGESADWFSRVKDAGIHIEILPYVLLRKRVHEANLSHHVDDTRANMMKILKASIGRKRERRIRGES